MSLRVVSKRGTSVHHFCALHEPSNQQLSEVAWILALIFQQIMSRRFPAMNNLMSDKISNELILTFLPHTLSNLLQEIHTTLGGSGTAFRVMMFAHKIMESMSGTNVPSFILRLLCVHTLVLCTDHP